MKAKWRKYDLDICRHSIWPVLKGLIESEASNFYRNKRSSLHYHASVLFEENHWRLRYRLQNWVFGLLGVSHSTLDTAAWQCRGSRMFLACHFSRKCSFSSPSLVHLLISSLYVMPALPRLYFPSNPADIKQCSLGCLLHPTGSRL